MRWRIAAAIILTVGSVRADPTPTERALARELFEQGRALMAKKSYTQACAKLAESQRLDPAPGTLLNLAVCHHADGKTATAYGEFNDAMTLARRDGRDDRVALAKQHLAELEPRLSRLTLVVSRDVRVDGLEIDLDGARVGKAAWGEPVPIDPGKHSVRATAPGRKPWSNEFSLGDNADEKSLTVPALVALPPSPSGHATAVSRRPKAAKSGSARRTAGYIVGATGIVEIGVGSYFGLRAFSRWSDRNAHCTSAGCDPAGIQADSDARRAAMFSNLGIAVGLVSVAAGTYLVLSGGSSEKPALAGAGPTPDGRGLQLRYDRAF